MAAKPAPANSFGIEGVEQRDAGFADAEDLIAGLGVGSETVTGISGLVFIFNFYLQPSSEE